MPKIKKQVYLDEDTLNFLEDVRQTNQFKTFGQAIDYCVSTLKRKENESIFTTVLSQTLQDTVIKTVKETMRPLMVRTGILDRDMKILMDIVNHNIMLDDRGVYAGEIITRQQQKSVPISKLEEEYKRQLEHFKQNADNKKVKREMQRANYEQLFNSDYIGFDELDE